MSHVPPGFFERDPSFGVFMKDQQGDDGHNDRYVDIVSKYQTVAHIYGHTHTDSFRIFKANVTGVAFVAPSITPDVNGQLGTNPSVRLYTYTNQSDYLDNYQQFYMDLNLANTESEITWQLLYDFKKSYKVPDLSVKSVMSVLNEVIASDESLHTFLQLNTVNKVNDPCKSASSIMRITHNIRQKFRT